MPSYRYFPFFDHPLLEQVVLLLVKELDCKSIGNHMLFSEQIISFLKKRRKKIGLRNIRLRNVNFSQKFSDQC